LAAVATVAAALALEISVHLADAAGRAGRK